MSNKEFLERMLSMLLEEFQDIYDDTYFAKIYDTPFVNISQKQE